MRLTSSRVGQIAARTSRLPTANRRRARLFFITSRLVVAVTLTQLRPETSVWGTGQSHFFAPRMTPGQAHWLLQGAGGPKGSRKNNLAFCCGSHARLNHNWQTAIVCCVWEPQPYGARPELARDPPRCHHIACVAAPCICLPGARAKMPTYSCANPKLLRE